jgi:hypothetical protein
MDEILSKYYVQNLSLIALKKKQSFHTCLHIYKLKIAPQLSFNL